MPSNRELATRYGVAPMTVHQAMRVLREEGLVIPYQGRGVFVTDPEHTTAGSSSGLSTVWAADVDRRIRDLSDRLGKRERHQADELPGLRQELADLKTRLMDLYAKTGHSYPHDDGVAARPAPQVRRRKASGA
jgi:DNA-binding transcriptional MocR family regulator